MLFPYSKKIPHTGERFFINCTDIGKFEGELENFPGTDWPECVVGCVDFPEMDNFKPKEKFYKLPNDTIEYECSKLGLVPHTGAKKNLGCAMLKSGIVYTGRFWHTPFNTLN